MIEFIVIGDDGWWGEVYYIKAKTEKEAIKIAFCKGHNHDDTQYNEWQSKIKDGKYHSFGVWKAYDITKLHELGNFAGLLEFED